MRHGPYRVWHALSPSGGRIQEPLRTTHLPSAQPRSWAQSSFDLATHWPALTLHHPCSSQTPEERQVSGVDAQRPAMELHHPRHEQGTKPMSPCSFLHSASVVAATMHLPSEALHWPRALQAMESAQSASLVAMHLPSRSVHSPRLRHASSKVQWSGFGGGDTEAVALAVAVAVALGVGVGPERAAEQLMAIAAKGNKKQMNDHGALRMVAS